MEAAGLNTDAVSTFNKVKTPDKGATVADLWSLVARGKYGV
jgi:hypothetical protein